MSFEEQMTSAIREALLNDGSFDKFKAEMCTTVFKVLKGFPNDVRKPTPCKSILIINQLIRDYLNWAGYKYTHMLFAQESGLSLVPQTNRSQLVQELGITETEDSLKFPLLYGIISSLLPDNQDE